MLTVIIDIDCVIVWCDRIEEKEKGTMHLNHVRWIGIFIQIVHVSYRVR